MDSKLFSLVAVLDLGIITNFVGPQLQNRYLQLCPFIALLSIIFWGWVWGPPGAFISVPITTAIILLTSEFQAIRPIAVIMGDTIESPR